MIDPGHQRIGEQAERLRVDDSVHPRCMAMWLSAAIRKRLGAPISDQELAQHLDAGRTWTQPELREAATRCRKRYPEASAFAANEVEQMIEMGRYAKETEAKSELKVGVVFFAIIVFSIFVVFGIFVWMLSQS